MKFVHVKVFVNLRVAIVTSFLNLQEKPRGNSRVCIVEAPWIRLNLVKCSSIGIAVDLKIPLTLAALLLHILHMMIDTKGLLLHFNPNFFDLLYHLFKFYLVLETYTNMSPLSSLDYYDNRQNDNFALNLKFIHALPISWIVRFGQFCPQPSYWRHVLSLVMQKCCRCNVYIFNNYCNLQNINSFYVICEILIL